MTFFGATAGSSRDPANFPHPRALGPPRAMSSHVKSPPRPPAPDLADACDLDGDASSAGFGRWGIMLSAVVSSGVRRLKRPHTSRIPSSSPCRAGDNCGRRDLNLLFFIPRRSSSLVRSTQKSATAEFRSARLVVTPRRARTCIVAKMPSVLPLKNQSTTSSNLLLPSG